MAASFGFFGKLPARGDFVSAGLPRSFIRPWDSWLRRVLPAALDSLGDAWDDAPIWRFRLAEGICGADPVLGVLLPSHDRVGRRFPLTVASAVSGSEDGALAAAEQLGCDAIRQGLPPERLAHLAADIRTDGYAGASRIGPEAALWWTDAGAVARKGDLVLPGLPDPCTFVTMLTSRHHNGIISERQPEP